MVTLPQLTTKQSLKNKINQKLHHLLHHLKPQLHLQVGCSGLLQVIILLPKLLILYLELNRNLQIKLSLLNKRKQRKAKTCSHHKIYLEEVEVVALIYLGKEQQIQLLNPLQPLLLINQSLQECLEPQYLELLELISQNKVNH